MVITLTDIFIIRFLLDHHRYPRPVWGRLRDGHVGLGPG